MTILERLVLDMLHEWAAMIRRGHGKLEHGVADVCEGGGCLVLSWFHLGSEILVRENEFCVQTVKPDFFIVVPKIIKSAYLSYFSIAL